MNESANTITSDERWTAWLERGARQDERIRRNMRLIAAIAVMIVWVSVSLL